MTAEPGALIGRAAEIIVPTDTGPEDAMGKTKGFTTTAFAACRLGHGLKGQTDGSIAFERFPDVLERVDRWVSHLIGAQTIFAVGSGPFNAVAPTSAFLLMGAHVERRDRLDAFLKAVAALDLPLLAVTDARTTVPSGGRMLAFALPDLGNAALEAILAVVPLQVLADRLALARGLDPDTRRYPFLYKILAAKSIYG